MALSPSLAWPNGVRRKCSIRVSSADHTLLIAGQTIDYCVKRGMSQDSQDQYRQYLVQAEQKAQEDYDKTLISLSGGALGISFAFIDRITTGPPFVGDLLLFLAWGSWVCSLLIMLTSFFLSRLACGQAIDEFDSGNIGSRPGGKFSWWTQFSNVWGGVLFFFGLLSQGVFIWMNLSVSSPAGGS